VQCITGKLNAPCNAPTELVDPLTQSPTHTCVARPLSPLADILLQVMNISPTPITIYKGAKLATMVPEYSVISISDTPSLVTRNGTPI